MAQWVLFKLFSKYMGKILNICFVIWITNVKNLTVAAVIFILDDSEQALYAVNHISKTPLLLSAIDQLYGGSLNEVEYKLGDDP